MHANFSFNWLQRCRFLRRLGGGLPSIFDRAPLHCIDKFGVSYETAAISGAEFGFLSDVSVLTSIHIFKPDNIVLTQIGA